MKLTIAATLFTLLAAGPTSAATLLIDFEGDAGDQGVLVNDQGHKSYEVGGYVMDPVSLQGGLCADDSSKCTIESTQTIEPMLTRIDETAFDLYSFYMLNTGNGSLTDEEPNRVILSIFDDILGAAIATLDFGNGLALDAYSAEFGVTITYYPGGSDPGADAGCVSSYICKNYGYLVSLGSWAEGIEKATWSAEGDAQARLDNITVSEVPVPAAGFLLLGGLGGLAMVRRRKS